jgi:hypothetical protein
MKVVYSASNLVMVAHFRSLLESHGVPCRIRNEFLAGAAGELPPVECWPQLCVEDHVEARAREILKAVAQPAQGQPEWTCSGCGELIEGQFTECWQCGRSHD